MVLRLLCGCLLALAFAAPAAAGSGLLVGVDDDGLKWEAEPGATLAVIRDVGVKAVRITLGWRAGETGVSEWNARVLDRVVTNSFGVRVVVALYGRPDEAPVDGPGRTAYCSSLADLVSRYPSVNDLVIWNEPNVSRFWRPQFDTEGRSAAPASYGSLLARCWDVLHAARPSVNVISASSPRGNDNPIAVSNVSHSPLNWYRQLADAYRASKRARPIFDTIGHNPYQNTNSERPWTVHKGRSLGEGDYGRLLQTLTDGFADTAQPLPGQGRVSIWYMEQGFQTAVPDDKRAFYTGEETDRLALAPVAGRSTASTEPAPDQATQLADAVRLASCQPAVGAIFNFELADEPDLSGWQSGVLWADRTPKPSYAAFKDAIVDSAASKVDCSRYPEAARAMPGPPVIRFTARAQARQEVEALTGAARVGAWSASPPRSCHSTATTRRCARPGPRLRSSAPTSSSAGTTSTR